MLGRILHLSLVWVAFCTLVVSGAFAEEPSDLFLKAYQEYQRAEKAEQDGNPGNALQRFKFAASLLEQLQRDNADWQPVVVSYRLKKALEAIERLEAAGATATAAPSVAASSDNLEGELPQLDPPQARRPAPTPRPRIQPTPTPRRSRTPQTNGGRQPETGDAIRSTALHLLEAENRELRNQLKQEKDRATDLDRRLQQAEASVHSALTELDRTKVNVVELKSQLDQVNRELAQAKKSGGGTTELRQAFEKQIAVLQEQIANQEADNEVLREENERLFSKLDTAVKHLQSVENIRLDLEAQRDASKTAMEQAISERDSAVTQRDEALAALEKQKTIIAEAEKITDENKSLSEKLSAAERRIEELNATKDATAKENEERITALNTELETVNGRLAELREENSRKDSRLTELDQQLQAAQENLKSLAASPVSEEEQMQLVAENELLKGIVMRQLKEQARKEQARLLVEEEISRLQVKSDTLAEQLTVLAAPVELTEQERSLFAEPMTVLKDVSPEKMDISIALTKPGGEPVPAPEASPTAELPLEEQPAVPVLEGKALDLAKQAKTLSELGNYEEAEKVYEKIVQIAPDNWFVMANLGVIQTRLDKFAVAEVCLKKAIELNPKDSFALTNLGVLYFRQARFEDALKALQQAVATDKNNPQAHNYLGITYGEQGDREKAEQELKKALELNPDYSVAHFNLAVLYATQQPPAIDLAREHYTKATQLGALPDEALEKLIQQ